MPPFDDPEICRNILETLPTGLCVVDMQKRILCWSSGSERITGYLQHEVVRHSCMAEPLLHCDRPGCESCSADCPLERAMKSAQAADATGFLHHKNGHEIPVRIRAVPVRNQHGSIIGAVETFDELQPGANREDLEAGHLRRDCVDNVTGLTDRAMMQSHLQHTMALFADAKIPLAVLLLQVHGLPHFRASLGHEAAASLLRVIARTLESALWTTDLIGRWSDDQFLVIVNGCHEQAINLVRERVRRMLAGEAIEWWGERRFLPVLIGEASAQAGDTVESLMERAQKSLETAFASSALGGNFHPSSGSQ